jgi:hypothetical protein
MQNHFCGRVAISRPITYSECVCGLSYPARKALEPYYTYIVICGSTMFYHIITKRARISKKKERLDFKKRVRFSLQLMSKKVSF